MDIRPKKIGPIIWQEEFPQKVKELFKEGTLNINNINLSGLVLNWLALECLTSNLANTCGALFYDNTSVVGWKIKLRLGSYLEVGRLLHFLGMQIHKA